MNPKIDRPEPADGTAKPEAPSLEVFLRRLSDTGLMSVEDVQAFVASLPAERRPQTADDLAREMVRQEKLTKFQAQALYLGKTRGMVVGNYVVHDQLGKGGMGFVYKARHKWMDRVVAIKMLPPSATNSPEAVERFQREVRAAARLSHPNIVAAFDADEADGMYCLVMEFVDGKDLDKLIRERGPLGVATAVDCVIQTAQGLNYAHGQGVIHRDVKPANLLLDKTGTVKILDMGLASMDEADEEADQSTDEAPITGIKVMGTLDYMAPEQASNTRSADARADIYALGCTLHYLLTGRRPYGGDSVMQKIRAHREEPIPSLRAARPDVPEWLDGIFRRMMAKRPEDRPQSMAELIAQLGQLQQESSSQTGGADAVVQGAETSSLKQAQSESSSGPSLLESVLSLRRTQSGRRLLWALAAAGLTVVVMMSALIFTGRANEGTLTVKLSDWNVRVLVLDEEGTVQIEQRPDQQTLTLSIAPGIHQLRVLKDGKVVFAQPFTVASGAQETIEAVWKPAEVKQTPPPPKPDHDATQPAADSLAKDGVEPAATPPAEPAAMAPTEPPAKEPAESSTQERAEPAAMTPAESSAKEEPAEKKAEEAANPPDHEASMPAREASTSAPPAPKIDASTVDTKKAVTVKLQPMDFNQGVSANYSRSIPIYLQEKPEQPLKAEPKYMSRPLYGTLHLGDAPDNAITVVLDQGNGNSPRIYIDRNRDRNLTNDGPGTWDFVNDKFCRLEDQRMDVPYKTGNIPSAFSFFWSRGRGSDRIMYHRRSERVGELVSDGKHYKFFVLDGNSDGRFDDLQDNDWHIDLNHDGRLDGGYRTAERHRMDKPVNIQGKVWQVTAMSPDGTSMTLCPSNAQVPMQCYIDVGLPAPPFTAIGLDGKPIDLKAEAASAKYILLQFWFRTPDRMRNEFPTIRRLQAEYGSRGLKIIGVCLEYDREKVRRTVREAGVDYPMVFDGKGSSGDVATLYRAGSGYFGLFDKDLKILVWGPGFRAVEGQLSKLFGPATGTMSSAEQPSRKDPTPAPSPPQDQDGMQKRIYLTAPYPGNRPGMTLDRILVPNAVQEICKQAGITYNLEKSRRVMGMAGQRLLRPDIQGKTADEALNQLLAPLGLTYRVENGELIVGKK